MNATLLLVRHADAGWREDQSAPLTERGVADADRLTQRLADLQIDAVYSSPHRRAHDTVEPLARRLGLTIREVPDLRERRLGDGPFEDYVGAVGATWDDFLLAHPGGESNTAAQRRMVAIHHVLARAHPGGSIVIATHGNALALLLRHYDPSIGFSFWRALTRPDVYRLRLDPARPASFERLWRNGR